jgi:hypothetical protein
MEEIMLELNGKPSSVIPSQPIFPSKTWFLNFQKQKSLKNQDRSHILNPNLTK